MKFFLALILLGSASVVLAAAEGRLITVSGECLKRVEPDRGSVTLVAEFTDKSAQVASKKTMEVYEQIRTQVKKMKLKDLELQTSHYTLNEESTWTDKKQVKLGMKSSLGLQVSTSEISRLGEVVALSGDLKINRVENLSTFLSPKKAKDEKEACLAEAVSNAKSKAEKMAQAVSSKIGAVQSIDETNGAGTPRPYQMMAMKSVAGESFADAAPMIESQAETISVNVQVRFGIQ